MSGAMTMREKMARAAYEGAGGPFKWETMAESAPLAVQRTQEEWLRRIDAALDVLLEPTDAMVNAGMNVGQIPAAYGEVEAHWHAMIRRVKEGA